MTYQVYAFAPDAELMDELDELDEAIARCEELVHEDGYPVAEIWDSSGDRVHSVGRSGEWTRGASRPGAAASSEAAPRFGFAEEVAEPDPDAPDYDAPDPDAAPVDDGGTSASSSDDGGTSASPDAPAALPTHERPSPEPATAAAPSPGADGAPRHPAPRTVIGNAAAAAVQWFGT